MRQLYSSPGEEIIPPVAAPQGVGGWLTKLSKIRMYKWLGQTIATIYHLPQKSEPFDSARCKMTTAFAPQVGVAVSSEFILRCIEVFPRTGRPFPVARIT